MFARTAFFHAAPRVTRVAVPDASGGLTTGFLVETWSQKANLLDHTLVDGKGAVLEIERRTNTDQVQGLPRRSDQHHRAGRPGTGPEPDAPSPSGWLGSGAQSTINIAGNNVRAYLDVDDNDSSGRRRHVRTTSGSFLSAPRRYDSRRRIPPIGNVAVQNLFYLNNVIHDTLFDPASTRPRATSRRPTSGRGGWQRPGERRSPGRRRARTTPTSRRRATASIPRMQMYLWNGPATHQVVVERRRRTTLPAPRSGSSSTVAAPLTGDLAVVNDGTGVLPATLRGHDRRRRANKIALIDRGTATSPSRPRTHRSPARSACSSWPT